MVGPVEARADRVRLYKERTKNYKIPVGACRQCRGRGSVPQSEPDGRGNEVYLTCKWCNGSGKKE